jgi:hypothetical protein
MLIFSESQIQAFQDDRFDQLCDWLPAHLRTHFAPQVGAMDAAALRALIDQSVARARQIGTTKTETTCQYVHLRVLFGEGFEGLDWVADTLARSNLKGDAMMGRLTELAHSALDQEEAAE